METESAKIDLGSKRTAVSFKEINLFQLFTQMFSLFIETEREKEIETEN